MSMRTWLARGAAALGAVAGAAFLGAQLVPYGRDHSNPPITQEPVWDSPRTRELAARACFDCHSNETTWPLYASVAPFSWIVQDHVDEGRYLLNFSEWDRPQREAEEAAEVVAEGEMPLWDYALMHPGARLSAAETRELVAGLRATLGSEEEEGELARAGHHDDEDEDD